MEAVSISMLGAIDFPTSVWVGRTVRINMALLMVYQ